MKYNGQIKNDTRTHPFAHFSCSQSPRKESRAVFFGALQLCRQETCISAVFVAFAQRH